MNSKVKAEVKVKVEVKVEVEVEAEVEVKVEVGGRSNYWHVLSGHGKPMANRLSSAIGPTTIRYAKG